MSDESFAVVEALERFAGDHGHSLLELAFAWLTSSPAVSCVIAGATSPDQLRANVGAIGAWRLTPGEREEVGRLTRADVAFAWHPGMPEYTQPPAGTAVGAPDLRRNVADERSGER
jgi:aryl-alcohol dehydrogenase-like predicted oxidoreductase